MSDQPMGGAEMARRIRLRTLEGDLNDLAGRVRGLERSVAADTACWTDHDRRIATLQDAVFGNRDIGRWTDASGSPIPTEADGTMVGPAVTYEPGGPVPVEPNVTWRDAGGCAPAPEGDGSENPDRCKDCGASNERGPWSHLVGGRCIDCRDKRIDAALVQVGGLEPEERIYGRSGDGAGEMFEDLLRRYGDANFACGKEDTSVLGGPFDVALVGARGAKVLILARYREALAQRDEALRQRNDACVAADGYEHDLTAARAELSLLAGVEVIEGEKVPVFFAPGGLRNFEAGHSMVVSQKVIDDCAIPATLILHRPATPEAQSEPAPEERASRALTEEERDAYRRTRQRLFAPVAAPPGGEPSEAANHLNFSKSCRRFLDTVARGFESGYELEFAEWVTGRAGVELARLTEAPEPSDADDLEELAIEAVQGWCVALDGDPCSRKEARDLLARLAALPVAEPSRFPKYNEIPSGCMHELERLFVEHGMVRDEQPAHHEYPWYWPEVKYASFGPAAAAIQVIRKLAALPVEGEPVAWRWRQRTRTGRGDGVWSRWFTEDNEPVFYQDDRGFEREVQALGVIHPGQPAPKGAAAGEGETLDAVLAGAWDDCRARYPRRGPRASRAGRERG